LGGGASEGWGLGLRVFGLGSRVQGSRFEWFQDQVLVRFYDAPEQRLGFRVGGFG